MSAKYVYTALFGGTANTFVVSTTGDIYGAGANQFGQLGVGTAYAKSISPVKMLMPAGVKAKTVQSYSSRNDSKDSCLGINRC